MRKTTLFIVLAFVIVGIQVSAKNSRNFEISKNLDIYNSLFKELDLYYVDSIQPEKLIKTSMDYMLSDLDPYTVYVPESEMKDFKFMTTGEYGGVGALIMKKGDYVVISEPYEGMPAEKADLKAGDIILKINGEDMKGKNTQDISEKLKGQPNTSVKVEIERPGRKKPFEVEITRQKIQINPVTYYGVLSNKIGYIHLSSFTDKASNEVRKALLVLKNDYQIEGLILDLRGNGGGILDEAVNIVNLFVEKDQEIVSTKGKVSKWDKVYKTKFNPIDTEIPLAILVNGNSASASEIVTGAFQDLDRAVIIGNRTFGKGLVQTTRPLPYGGSLKITTAKYYIPSGRFIQAIDYTHKNENGNSELIPDSLTNEYKTKSGRIVRDGRGINPDITLEAEKAPIIAYRLMNELILFDYVTEYCLKYPRISEIENFTFTDEEYEDFKKFVKEKNFSYKLKSPELLKKVKEMAEIEGYFDLISEEYAAIESKLQPNLDQDLELFKKQIKEFISVEIIQRYYHQKGAIIESLKNDAGVEKAVNVLSGKEKYREILSGQVVEEKE